MESLILFKKVMIKRNLIKKNLGTKEKKVPDQRQKNLTKNPTNFKKMEIKINQKKNKTKMNNLDHKYVDKSKKFLNS